MSYNPAATGTNFQGSARSLQTGYVNGTGSTIAQGTPVSINTSGQAVLVDISSDASVNGIVGIYAAATPSAAKGLVLDCGRLENITTAYSVGTAVYINTDGTLTSSRPDYGVGSFSAGDYIVFAGVIVQNEFNPSLVDLKVYMDVIGQL